MNNKVEHVYNLEFPNYCDDFEIFGYKFKRVAEYVERIKSLDHLVTMHSEFTVNAHSGNHAITAFVEIPAKEEKAVFEWQSKSENALQDILLLLSLFNGREIFYHRNDALIIADPRAYAPWGRLKYAIPYKRKYIDDFKSYDVGFEEGINKVYTLIRTKEWLTKYDHGYFLFILNQAFKRQAIETTLILCWSVWEQLFTLHNRKWLSDDKIWNMPSKEKISFILVEYALKAKIDSSDKKRIKELAEIRNRLVHYGKIPSKSSLKDAELFIRLTEFIILRILGLLPSDIFNTIDKLEAFLKKHN